MLRRRAAAAFVAAVSLAALAGCGSEGGASEAG